MIEHICCSGHFLSSGHAQEKFLERFKKGNHTLLVIFCAHFSARGEQGALLNINMLPEDVTRFINAATGIGQELDQFQSIFLFAGDLLLNAFFPMEAF